jgi:hypothetical protein
VPAAVLVLALANTALLLSAISFLPRFASSIAAVSAAVAAFSTLMGRAAALLTSPSSSAIVVPLAGGGSVAVTPLLAAFSDGASAATAMRTALSGAAGAIAAAARNVASARAAAAVLDGGLSSLAASLAGVASSVAGAAAPLVSAEGFIKDPIASIPLDTVRSTLVLAGSAALAAAAALLALQAVVVCRRRCACCLFKGLALVSVLLTAAVFVVAGAFFVVAVVGSDLCFSPYTTLTRLVAAGNDIASATARFYLTCVPGAPYAPQAVPTVLDVIASNLAAATSQVSPSALAPLTAASAGLAALAPGAWPTPAYTANASAMTAAIAGAAAPVNVTLNSVLSCAAVAAVVDPLVEGICGGAVEPAIGVTCILLSAGILLALQLAVGVDLCLYHPGDVKAWTEGMGGGGLKLREPAVPFAFTPASPSINDADPQPPAHPSPLASTPPSVTYYNTAPRGRSHAMYSDV